MSKQIKAIETQYAGCRFRSRLEARWAVFFDTLGVQWEYEPQGFDLPSGPYLPDFWLPDYGWWEVKGTESAFGSRDDRVITELAVYSGERVFMAWGSIPRSVDRMGHSEENRRIDVTWYSRYEGEEEVDLTTYWDTAADDPFPRPWISGDIDYAWCVCPWCGKIGVQYEGRSARICGWRSHSWIKTEDQALELISKDGHWRADDKCYTADNSRILEAYQAARSARFEHGESGAPVRKYSTVDIAMDAIDPPADKHCDRGHRLCCPGNHVCSLCINDGLQNWTVV